MNAETFWLLIILGSPLVVALILAVLSRFVKRTAGWLAALGALGSLVGAFALIPVLEAGLVPTLSFHWIPRAGIDLRLHLDWLSLPFLITEAGVTLVAIVYAWGYHHADERTPYFYALLLLFAVGMAGTTLADDLFLFYIFWELMLVASCILILMWGDGAQRGAVALKYFIFTHLGSLLVLVGFLFLYDAAGSDSFLDLQVGAAALSPTLVKTVITLFLIGFSVKMAIFPLHLWLPDAHTVAPMPVTIMLAAAMLSMGTYGVLRFPMTLFSIEEMMPFTMPMMVAGVISEVYGAAMALAEKDVKRVIAYSSVSQMGYILFGLGSLTYNGIAGATLHVIYHAVVKALLFMSIGLVIHATGKRLLSELGGLGKAMPVTAFCAGMGALAIAGMPPLCVFDSEWLIFSGDFNTGHIGLAAMALFGSLLTVVYAVWFVTRIFWGKHPEGVEVEPLPLAMIAPTVFLAVLTLIEGLFPAPVFNWVSNELPLILGGGLR